MGHAQHIYGAWNSESRGEAMPWTLTTGRRFLTNKCSGLWCAVGAFHLKGLREVKQTEAGEKLR